jgi:hypothetical protein
MSAMSMTPGATVDSSAGGTQPDGSPNVRKAVPPAPLPRDKRGWAGGATATKPWTTLF